MLDPLDLDEAAGRLLLDRAAEADPLLCRLTGADRALLPLEVRGADRAEDDELLGRTAELPPREGVARR